jgi:hypothetical protein
MGIFGVMTGSKPEMRRVFASDIDGMSCAMEDGVSELPYFFVFRSGDRARKGEDDAETWGTGGMAIGGIESAADGLPEGSGLLRRSRAFFIVEDESRERVAVG